VGEVVEGGPADAHALGVYDTEAFLVATVAGFVGEALASGAMAVAVLPARDHPTVREELSDRGLEVARAEEETRLRCLDSDTVRRHVTAGGALDVDAYESMAQQLLATAAERGCQLHICGNMHSVLWEAGEIEALLAVEDLWNRVTDSPPVRVLCMYASEVFDRNDGDDRFVALSRRHARVRPVEDFASLVGSEEQRRPVALLEQQERASRLDRDDLVAQVEQIAADLDACIRSAEQRRDQFEQAVVTRDVIGQAKGIIMTRWHIDAEAAFAMLRDASSRSHRKVHEVAAAVVEQQLRMS
jgi:hypothetical protein